MLLPRVSPAVTNSRVTVLIPCFQQAHYLPEAVDSALAQTTADLEIIIINDGSTDETHEVASRYVAQHPGRVRLVQQENLGLTLARAAGLRAASGQYLVFLDADDILEPNMVATCVRAFERQPRADLVVGNAWLVAEDGHSAAQPHDQQHVPRWPTVLEVNPFGALVAIMMRTDAVRRVGGLAVEGILGCVDWDLWARMIRCGMEVLPIPDRLGRYRRHAGAISRDPLLMLDSKIQMLDCCVRDDERLHGSGLRPARPISQRAYARLRNGAVFHELALAIALELPAARLDEILARLAGEHFDPFFCAQQFARGWAHAHGREASPPPDDMIGSPLARTDMALEHIGLGQFSGSVRRELPRAFTPRRDAVWVWRGVARRLRRLAAEISLGA